jgi:hypothetical protein
MISNRGGFTMTKELIETIRVFEEKAGIGWMKELESFFYEDFKIWTD